MTSESSTLSSPSNNDEGNDGNNGKVIIIGSINQDLTTYAPSLPTPGETLLGTDFRQAGGGKGANQAVAAAALIQNGVCMIGKVGNDPMGHTLLNGLRSRGVQIKDEDAVLQSLEVSAGMHTGVASINVDTQSGQNTIVVAPGANLALSLEEVEESLTHLLGGGANNDNRAGRDVVLIQLEIPPTTAKHALKIASKYKALTVLNPAPAPKGWELTNKEWLEHIDILIPNESELVSLCGLDSNVDGSAVTGEGEEAMAKSLLDRGVRHAVIVTLGARGAMIVRRKDTTGDTLETAEDTETIMVNAPSSLPQNSLPVVDTTGAGDAFCGALVAYLSRGVGLEGLNVAASMACGVASMSVRKRGTWDSYPTNAELPDCLRLDGLGETANGNFQRDDSGTSNKKSTITFVTGNKNKLAEVQRLLSTQPSNESLPSKHPFAITNAPLSLPELQGSAEQIAREKCRQASDSLQTAVFTEDTSLGFHALNGLPGPYIKYFLEDVGLDGLNNLLVGFGKGDESKEHKRAFAQTIIAFCPSPGKPIHIFKGQTEGIIVPPRGNLDFGWDPIFEPLPEECARGGLDFQGGKTYAEMEKDEKNKISHRGRAFEKFYEYLVNFKVEILEDMKEGNG